jgi:hypothetical protein
VNAELKKSGVRPGEAGKGKEWDAYHTYVKTLEKSGKQGQKFLLKEIRREQRHQLERRGNQKQRARMKKKKI